MSIVRFRKITSATVIPLRSGRPSAEEVELENVSFTSSPPPPPILPPNRESALSSLVASEKPAADPKLYSLSSENLLSSYPYFQPSLNELPILPPSLRPGSSELSCLLPISQAPSLRRRAS